MKQTFAKRSRFAAPAPAVFAWHESPDALRQLIPPGDPVKVISHTGGIRDGARVVLEIGSWPLTMRWVAVHRDFVAGERFTDVQEKGPFRSWEHTHSVQPDGPEACFLTDHVVYELPFGWLGAPALPFVRKKLRQMFDWRHIVTARAVSAQNAETHPPV